jgi:hypothetical protein
MLNKTKLCNKRRPPVLTFQTNKLAPRINSTPCIQIYNTTLHCKSHNIRKQQTQIKTGTHLQYILTLTSQNTNYIITSITRYVIGLTGGINTTTVHLSPLFNAGTIEGRSSLMVNAKRTIFLHAHQAPANIHCRSMGNVDHYTRRPP